MTGFGIRTHERTALFIDGPNLYSTAKSMGFDIDFKRMRDLFDAESDLVRAFYYTAIREDEPEQVVRPLIDWLDYNGFHMVTKPTKEYTDSMGRRKIKGNLDVELTVDMLEMAPRIDHAVMFTGDGDYRRAIEAVQSKGVKVTVVSTLENNSVADELRRQADRFVDLRMVRPLIERVQKPMANRGPSGDEPVPARKPAASANAEVTPRAVRLGDRPRQTTYDLR